MGCLCVYMCASVPGVRGREWLYVRVSVHEVERSRSVGIAWDFCWAALH